MPIITINAIRQGRHVSVVTGDLLAVEGAGSSDRTYPGVVSDLLGGLVQRASGTA
ncbi:hypothetical protein [Streptomyces chartreusis]|uniref:hypothetical protein n=1 Tax=Streptomyces chartreusis TaxID=1969 RepID=UPI0036AE4BD7